MDMKQREDLAQSDNVPVPGRVFKGMKMAGHMGSETVTVRNLKVVKVIPEKNLLLVRGGIPGPDNGLLLIKARED